MDTNVLEIVTLNCQRGYRVSELQVYLDRLIHEGNINFLLLQEVNTLVFHTLKEIIKRSLNYQILRPINPKTQKPTEVAIVYRLDHQLLESEYLSYSGFTRKRTNETGAIIGTFSSADHGKIVVCCSHLHASYMFRVRQLELRFIKEKLLKFTGKLILFGGDFNYLLPGELKRGGRLLSPEFVHISTYTEHSCDSSLLEPTEFQNKLFRFLGSHGLAFLLQIDHIYMDRESSGKYLLNSCVHDVIVSDHRPISVTLKRKN